MRHIIEQNSPLPPTDIRLAQPHFFYHFCSKKKSLEELTATMALLQQEKDEELRRYQETIQNLTLEERRKTGVTWFPLNIVKTSYAIGDLPYLIVERTSFINELYPTEIIMSRL